MKRKQWYVFGLLFIILSVVFFWSSQLFLFGGAQVEISAIKMLSSNLYIALGWIFLFLAIGFWLAGYFEE